MPTDPFAALGLDPTATVSELRAAFRREALRHHPDRNLGDPGATRRFGAVLRAYRRAVEMATDGRVRAETPRGPRPDRYECGTCGDCFPFAEPCPRCGVETWDRNAGPAVRRDAPAVTEMIAWLEGRPDPDAPTWEERLPVPGLLVAGCLAGALFAYQVGPVGLALLLAGFSTYVTALELHRRATTSPF